MNKKVYRAVEERSESLCEFPVDEGKCNGNYICQQHHVFGKYNRSRLEMPQTVFKLCYDHHLDPHTGVHFNKHNREILENIAKDNLRKLGWSEEKITKEIYLDSRG